MTFFENGVRPHAAKLHGKGVQSTLCVKEKIGETNEENINNDRHVYPFNRL